MKPAIFILFFSLSTFLGAQNDAKISTIDFVQVLADNHAEALHYYQNNWKVLREMAITKDYIHSFQFLKNEASEDAPFHFILITTYATPKQYKLREENFGRLIEQKGPLNLLNEKKPGEFRKVLFGKDPVKHLGGQ